MTITYRHVMDNPDGTSWWEANVNGHVMKVSRSRERGYPDMPGAPGNGRPHAHEYEIACRVLGREPLRVLDCACGSGYGTAMLREAGHEAVGVDVSEEAIAFARAAYGERAWDAFYCQDMDGGPEPRLHPEMFDAVVSIESIEHTTRYREALREFHRVLKPGGVMVITTPQGSEWKPLSPHHPQEFGMLEFAELLHEAGFSFDRQTWLPHPHAWVVVATVRP